MKEEQVLYKKKIQSFQMTILVIKIFVMMIGGCIFGLGVKMRPALRITTPEAMSHVEWILDMMIATGLCGLATAGLDCFAACWKLIWPIYFGIGVTALTVCLGLAAVGTSLHLLHTAEDMANENIVHAWYWVECQSTDSCHQAMLAYIYHYTLPQIILTATAVFLQCLAIFYLGRMVKSIAEHDKMLENYKEWYREQMDNPDKAISPPKHVPPQPIENTSPSSFELIPRTESPQGADENNENEVMEGMQLKVEDFDNDNPNYRSPSSILKTDHGYVAASGGSLDYNDSPVQEMQEIKNRPKEKVSQTQSISFNTDVQVHYYND